MPEKPLSQKLWERMGGRNPGGFDASVYPRIVAPPEGLVPFVPETVIEAEPTAVRDADGLLGRLMELQSLSLSPELAERVSAAASNLAEAIAAAEVIEAEVETESRKELQKRYSIIRKEGRRLHKKVAELKQSLDLANGAGANAIAQRDNEIRALNEAKALERRGQHVPQWPTDEELASWAGQKTRVQNKIVQANENLRVCQEHAREISAEFEKASAYYETIKQEEIRVRHALDGKPYFDQELGLADRPGVTG